MHSCYLSLALVQYPGVLLQLREPSLRLTDGGFLLPLNKELCSLLLLSQYFDQGGELDVDPGGSLLKSHLLMENAQLYAACFEESENMIIMSHPQSLFLSF